MSELHIILTCDGGNGHKAAASALESKAKANADTVKMINTTRTGWFSGGGLDISPKHDHLIYKGIVDLGPFAVSWWDWAQRTSHTELLSIFASMRKLSFLSIPSFRYRTYQLLAGETQDINNYSEVILHNTQPNCLKALVFSVARYNREVETFNKENPNSPQKNKVKFINHFTDMPTLHAQMFIEEMADIDIADLDDAQFELWTRMPIIQNQQMAMSSDEIESQYHQHLETLYPKLYYNLPSNKERVKIVNGPIREEFIQRKETPANRSDGLNIQFSDQAEFDVANSALNESCGTYNPNTSSALIPLTENVEIVSIMLGSQASISGTLELLKEEIKFSKQCATKKKVFVFCGPNKPQEGLVLYQKVLKIAQEVNSTPDSPMEIIPLTNQPASMIADLYSMADRIISRPGGISIMEIEAVAKKAKIFIFTELGKLSKILNRMLRSSHKKLQEKYVKQGLLERYMDLIAWEQGNGKHAENICKDENGRTRVVPVNVYTYGYQLELSNKKDDITKLILNKDYKAVLDTLSNDPDLATFFLSGTGVGTKLASLAEINQLYTRISKDLKYLIDKYKELADPKIKLDNTLALIDNAQKSIHSKLEKKEEPFKILKDLSQQITKITSSLEENIEAIRKSNIENTSFLVRILEIISIAISNFFRIISGLNKKTTAVEALEQVDADIKQTLNTPSILEQDLLNYKVDDEQWDEVDTILKGIPKSKGSFILNQSEHPQLASDFLITHDDTGDVTCYAIGQKLGEGGCGIVSLVQNRLGEVAIMKQHKSDIKNQPSDFEREFQCLEKMNLSLNKSNSSTDCIMLQKYIPGKSLNNFLTQHVTNSAFTLFKPAIENKKLKLSIALAQALKAVTDKGIIHGDITPDNVLIHVDQHQQITATFIDFGLAQIENNPRKLLPLPFSPYFGAPELVKALQTHQDGILQVYPYSEKSDIYSLGIVLRDIDLNHPIVKQMIDKDPIQRPSINEVLSSLTIGSSPNADIISTQNDIENGLNI